MESIAFPSLEGFETTCPDDERHLAAVKVKKVRSKKLRPKQVQSKKVSVRAVYRKNVARDHARQVNGDVHFHGSIHIHIPQMDRAERLQSFSPSTIENLIAQSLRRDVTSLPNEVVVERTERLQTAPRMTTYTPRTQEALEAIEVHLNGLSATNSADVLTLEAILSRYSTSSRNREKKGKPWGFKLRPGWTSLYFNVSIAKGRHGWGLHVWTYNLVPRESKIFELCEDGDIGGLRDLFATGQASSHDARDLGYCLQWPLHVALQRGDVDLCKFLLQYGLLRDMYQGLELWCDFYAEYTKSGTLVSIKSPHMDILRLLLDSGLDPEDVPSLRKVVPSGWISELPEERETYAKSSLLPGANL